MATDLGELVRARLADKIEQGKSPSKADLLWLDATQERPASESSVETSRNAKGEMQFAVKVYNGDPLEAERIAKEIAARLRATFPMSDDTVGSPIGGEMSAPLLHFVCDRCGNYWRAYRSQKCPACKSASLWQFDREQPARDHAAHIRDPHVSVTPL